MVAFGKEGREFGGRTRRGGVRGWRRRGRGRARRGGVHFRRRVAEVVPEEQVIDIIIVGIAQS